MSIHSLGVSTFLHAVNKITLIYIYRHIHIYICSMYVVCVCVYIYNKFGEN